LSTLKNPVGEHDHVKGELNAPAVLVEYGDFQCPHCRMAHAVIHRVQKHFGDRLCFVFRNFPLTQIHPYAQAAAETAEFAGAYGKFWEMHDLLFEHQERLGDGLFAELAEKLGLDPSELAKALEDGTYTSKVRSGFTGGVRSGVNGTPTFFINGERHNGPADYDSLARKISEALES
jgi:protein-disulfide isomerase